MNILQKLKNKLYSKEVKKNNKAISIAEFQGLTIIGTKKELNQLPLKVQALAHNIYIRNADNTLTLTKMRSLPCKATRGEFYFDKEGYGRVPQKDGKHRKDDPYALWC